MSDSDHDGVAEGWVSSDEQGQQQDPDLSCEDDSEDEPDTALSIILKEEDAREAKADLAVVHERCARVFKAQQEEARAWEKHWDQERKTHYFRNSITGEMHADDPRRYEDQMAATRIKAAEATMAAAPKKHQVEEVEPESLGPGDRVWCPVCKVETAKQEWVTHRSSIGHQMSINMQGGPPTKTYGLGPNNKGYQMLKSAMGWKEDQGLGAANQGRLDPIKTVIRTKHAGLGTQAPKAAITHKNPTVPKLKKQNPLSKKQVVKQIKADKRKRAAIWKSLRDETPIDHLTKQKPKKPKPTS
eukprot:TRINITY_DN2523_c0_g2_i1.p1 TRINITY_DN2523_c0_g2~~TRINITY_DN2523_c0_g2_i1.p1  ORF type:complete len:300 (-),score=84.40 TRINITY_DN2523_c0_g2_i1:424-1323(-)